MEEVTIFDIPKEICSTATTCLKNSKKKKKEKRNDPDFIKDSLRKETTDNLKKYRISWNNQKETPSR